MRRGFSTVVAGGLIILVLSMLATIFLIYLDANQYKLIQTGESISRDLRRETESLYIFESGGSIWIKNVGSTPVEIRYLAEKDGENIRFKEVNIVVDVGEKVPLSSVMTNGRNIFFITSRGKIFTLNSLNGSNQEGSNIFQWVNSTYLQVNIPLNISDSIIKIENSILIIKSQSYGYLVVDLYRGEILHQGSILMVPTRDGEVVYVRGNVYLGGKLVLYGFYRLEYVGYNYLVVSGSNYVYIVVSDGSIYTYTSEGLRPDVIYNGETLTILGYIGKNGNIYRYYLTSISPFNYSLIENNYIDLPIRLSRVKPSNVYLPGDKHFYIGYRGNVTRLLGFSMFRVNNNEYINHVFSTGIRLSNGVYEWGFNSWYFNTEGSDRYSNIDFIESLSTLETGIPMEWQIIVQGGDTPYFKEDIRVYNLSSKVGFLSIVSELRYGYSGFIQNGSYSYKYIVGGDGDFLEIVFTVIMYSGGKELNVSIYSLYPSKRLINTLSLSLSKPILSIDLSLNESLGTGFIHIYDRSLRNPYITTLMFDFPKPTSSMLLKIINSTKVIETSNYQYSSMDIKIFVFGDQGYFVNPLSIDYLDDGVINRVETYYSFDFVVTNGGLSKLRYINDSISIVATYVYPVNPFESSYLITLPLIKIVPLHEIDSVGLHLINSSNFRVYPIDIPGRYDWKILVYNNLYVVLVSRFGGVDIYVYRY